MFYYYLSVLVCLKTVNQIIWCHVSCLINHQNNNCMLSVDLCPHGTCVFPDKDNSVPTGKTSLSLVWGAWQQWHHCNNLITSQRSFCGKQKHRNRVVQLLRIQTITPNLILVAGPDLTRYLTSKITPLALSYSHN